MAEQASTLPVRLASKVDEVFDFFETFADGSYSDSENWDPTMNAELLPALRVAFNRLLFALDGLEPEVVDEQVEGHLRDFYATVVDLNAQGEQPVVEVEEMHDLWEILEAAFAQLGLPAEVTSKLITWEQYLVDIEDEQ